MLDLELLKTLVCVVDEGSFTRAAERVHRTQSTVSQQVRRLEESLGHALLLRDRSGNQVTATTQGELLAQYARRLLALAQEAEEAMASDGTLQSLRLGVPEDFDTQRMTALLASFAGARPEARLETVSGMSVDLRRKLASGELDIALLKREPGSGECLASWPERLVWVKGQQAELAEQPLPLALFPQGCLYRQRAIRSLDKARRPWRIAFGSASLTGIQAAVASGLGVSVLPESAVLAQHSRCDDLPALAPSELALVSGGAVTALQRELLALLQDQVMPS
ncbi:MAG: LysR family transcriptional regulator [Pseudomonas sp.]